MISFISAMNIIEQNTDTLILIYIGSVARSASLELQLAKCECCITIVTVVVYRHTINALAI